jgi:hypothetical protein
MRPLLRLLPDLHREIDDRRNADKHSRELAYRS